MKNQMDEKLYAILAKHGLDYAHGRMREAVEEAYELGIEEGRKLPAKCCNDPSCCSDAEEDKP